MDRIEDKFLSNYCKHVLKARIKVLKFDFKKRSWYWDYPAAISVCYDKSKSRHKNGYAHDPSGTHWHEVLRKKLNRLGEIGSHPSKCETRYIVGQCAEQHSGNNFMNAYNEKDLHSLYFSVTIRPRTGQILKPCANCKFVFPNLNEK